MNGLLRRQQQDPPAKAAGRAWPRLGVLAVTVAGLAASVLPRPAAAQGTWLQTQCWVAAAAAPGPCKASPAWGQTGVDHVQALAAAAGPGNLGLSLVKPETLPAAHAARAQLAAVMLAYLDTNRAGPQHRWFGPVAAPATAAAAVTTRAVQPTGPVAAAAAAAPTTPAAPAANPGAAHSGAALQSIWLGGALGEQAPARSASWWLAGPYRGATTPVQVSEADDPYRVLRFLAAQCPQLEGKVAPNAWTRCTAFNVPEPASWALVGLALLGAAMARRLSGRRSKPAAAGHRL